MNINKFLDRSTVKFKQPVGSNELDSLLSHISKKINCGIRYSSIKHKSIDSKGYNQDSECLDEMICGRVGDNDDHVKFIVHQYNEKKPNYKSRQFGEIEFSSPLRYGVHDLPKSYLSFVKNVRKAVNDYFSK